LNYPGKSLGADLLMIETQVGATYEVRDMALASQGHRTIEWAENHMPVVMKIRERFAQERPLENIKIGACLHVTKETAVLALTWQAGGADVYLCASNPLSTQDLVAAALAEKNIKVYAWREMDNEGYYRSIANVIKGEPHITIDDGADVVSTLHKLKRGETGQEIDIVKNTIGDRTDWLDGVWAGAEETTTGIQRLRAMANDGALLYPILATNDTPTKWEFDNLWGTGQSTIDGILRATADLIAGKIFVVAGYGHCGRGVALRAKGLGARRVIITEIAPHRALTAAMEGIDVMPMLEAAEIGDIFVTATGCKDVITRRHMERMKDGAVLCNTGHFDVEVDLKSLKEMATSVTRLRPVVDQYLLPDNRKLYVLGEGRLVNLAAAEGHPSEVMDLSFSDQALTVEYIVKNRETITAQRGKVIEIPAEIDLHVATLKCEAMGIKLDKLTEEQYQYVTGWREGTI